MFLLVLLSLASSTAYAIQPASKDPDSLQGAIRLTSQVELSRLVDITAQLNQVEIEYGSSTLDRKSITLRLTHDLSPQELWELCLISLHKEDLTIIRRNGERGLYSVVPIQTAASDALPQQELESTGLMPGYQSVIVPLGNIRPDDLVKQVQAMLTTGNKLKIEVVEGTQSVIVRGTVDRLRIVLGLVHQIDTAKSPPEMRVVELRNRAAVEVIADVNSIISALDKQGGRKMSSSLVASPGGDSVRVFGPAHELDRIEALIRDADQRAAIETRVFDTKGYPLDSVAQFLDSMARDTTSRGSGDSWKIIQDSFTNTIIITATQTELAAVEEALARLGEMPADAQRMISMIEVHNREASKLRETVAQLLAARVLGGQAGYDGQPRDRSTDPQLGQPQESLLTHAAPNQLSDLELAVDEELNVIIATGSPRRIEQVKQLVAQLDVRQPQVQLEVILLSLSESETRDLGVELAGNIDTGKTLVGLGSLFGISSISPSSTSAQASGSGGSAVVLSPGDFSAVIRAIQTVNSGRSASMPSIVVNNNETATLNSTTTQPYLTTTITDSGTTTARGGSASAGTTITVSPQIAAGDHIVLDYSFTLSSFVGEASADGVEPPTQQTSLNSIATIPDGYTIVLGGIESTSEGDSDTKTPLLADIPLLGELFKSQSDSTSRSRFYVFIRATVMRSPSFEYLKYISEDLASEVGVDDGWPEVEPRIIR